MCSWATQLGHFRCIRRCFVFVHSSWKKLHISKKCHRFDFELSRCCEPLVELNSALSQFRQRPVWEKSWLTKLFHTKNNSWTFKSLKCRRWPVVAAEKNRCSQACWPWPSGSGSSWSVSAPSSSWASAYFSFTSGRHIRVCRASLKRLIWRKSCWSRCRTSCSRRTRRSGSIPEERRNEFTSSTKLIRLKFKGWVLCSFLPGANSTDEGQ